MLFLGLKDACSEMCLWQSYVLCMSLTASPFCKTFVTCLTFPFKFHAWKSFSAYRFPCVSRTTQILVQEYLYHPFTHVLIGSEPPITVYNTDHGDLSSHTISWIHSISVLEGALINGATPCRHATMWYHDTQSSTHTQPWTQPHTHTQPCT